MAEHLLDAAEIGAALEQVRRERVAQQMRVDARRLEAGLLGQAAQDQERARAGQRAALGVQEELRAVAAVQERAAAAQVAAQRVGRAPAERDDALLAALADRADEALVEVDAAPLEADRLADAQARAVEELDERAVAQRRAESSRWRPRSAAPPRRARASAAACARGAAAPTSAAGLSVARADQHLVAEERADRGAVRRAIVVAARPWRGARPRSARAPRSWRREAVRRARRRTRSGRGGTPRPSAARSRAARPRGSSRPQDLGCARS